MNRYILINLFFALLIFSSHGQNTIAIKAKIKPETKSIEIQQVISYKNTSNDTLYTIYLSDWNNSYSNKSTALAKRFEEEFSTKFHLAKDKERGFTDILKIEDSNGETLQFQHLKNQVDVLEVRLKQPLLPNQFYNLNLSYTLTLPDAQFTDYGFTENEDFELKHWYLTPAVYDGSWQYYSNKDLDDLYVPTADVTITLTFPADYTLISELNTLSKNSTNGLKTNQLSGKNRVETYLSLRKNSDFEEINTGNFTLITNIQEKELDTISRQLIINKVGNYLSENLGDYPHDRLVVSQIDYNKNPLYGLNQLPSFLRPFKSEFQFEMKLLKTALNKYISNIHFTNPRKDHWINDGLAIYFLMKYVEDFYPDKMFLGTLANVWGIRAFHMAEVDFNFQYFLYFMEIARKNNDQAITTSKDSLTKFNANIAGRYKAGMGLNYLDDYTEDFDLQTQIKNYFNLRKLKPSTSEDFKKFLQSNTSKNLDWFFGDYLTTRKKIDYKLINVKTENDSISLTIKNKESANMPMPVFSLRKDSIVGKTWVENIGTSKTLKIPYKDTDRVVLDYKGIIPEFNRRNNYKSTKGSNLFSKPLQFRLIKDIEDPYYNQIFLMPVVEFNNIYDGLTLGGKVYNKTILRRRLNYKFTPKYSFNSKTITGSGNLFYSHIFEDTNLFRITYGIDGSYRSFDQDAFFRRIRPNISFNFRDKDDLRSDKRHLISLRYVDIARTLGEDALITETETDPDYSILNLRYVYSSPGIINFERFFADFQVASNFSKFSVNYEYRKLSKNNRNYNFRFFAGTFLENNTDPNSSFFNFALDRPTDYLFDFNYLGRSEASGIFSQQLIIAEGGFKSQLDTPFANQWLTTANFSTSIWRYIQAYGDIGLVKNRGVDPKFVYDSGVHLNLVPDYLELFFPVYSNNGWEIAQPNYAEKIRFIVTVDPQVLLGLFRRKWY